MTETPERTDELVTGPVPTLSPPPPPPPPPPPLPPPAEYYGPVPAANRPNRLYQVAAWVAIVAGVVFITGAVFFTGFAMGRHSVHDGGWRHYGGSEFHRRGGPPMMMPGPMMPGPGIWAPMGPGFGPGGPMGPGSGPGGPMGPGNGPGPTATPLPRP